MKPPLPQFIVPQNVADARKVQDTLREKLVLKNDFTEPHIIAGVDVGYDGKTDRAHASIVTMHIDTLKPIEQVTAYATATFPYVPGFLSFREIPAILAAIALLQRQPDVWMVDGQGIAHPRRMGIAAHLGALLDAPSLGVAKSRLAGDFAELGPQKGEAAPLTIGREQVGYVLRSKQGCKPLFISAGHRMDLDTALALTLRCLTTYRLPEPTRLADKWSKVKHPNKNTPELDLAG